MAVSPYAGGRRGKEWAARYERSNDWRRGAQRPRPEAGAPPTLLGRDAIVRQMTRLQWIYVIVGLVVVVAMVIPMFATGR